MSDHSLFVDLDLSLKLNSITIAQAHSNDMARLKVDRE
jgi:hypothetical protein